MPIMGSVSDTMCYDLNQTQLGLVYGSLDFVWDGDRLHNYRDAIDDSGETFEHDNN